ARQERPLPPPQTGAARRPRGNLRPDRRARSRDAAGGLSRRRGPGAAGRRRSSLGDRAVAPPGGLRRLAGQPVAGRVDCRDRAVHRGRAASRRRLRCRPGGGVSRGGLRLGGVAVRVWATSRGGSV
ncbi:MAG: hypothetical protein AVDCRST_MAG59-744, partial [uncultured Thermomicrobiales bacterium]